MGLAVSYELTDLNPLTIWNIVRITLQSKSRGMGCSRLCQFYPRYNLAILPTGPSFRALYILLKAASSQARPSLIKKNGPRFDMRLLTKRSVLSFLHFLKSAPNEVCPISIVILNEFFLRTLGFTLSPLYQSPDQTRPSTRLSRWPEPHALWIGSLSGGWSSYKKGFAQF